LFDLTLLSVKELYELQNEIKKELKKRELDKNSYIFEFEITYKPPKPKPYVAKIVDYEDDKFIRDFFSFEEIKAKNSITLIGDYSLDNGDIVEVREYGKHRWLKVCIDGDLKVIGDGDKSNIKLLVLKYLKKEISVYSL
jgi:DNA polymerase III epsilon subunit-like protein